MTKEELDLIWTERKGYPQQGHTTACNGFNPFAPINERYDYPPEECPWCKYQYMEKK